MVDDNEPADSRRIGIRVETGKALSFDTPMPPNDASLPGAEEARRIVRALRSYRTALSTLVSTKYAAVASSLPRFYSQAANILILRCTDGVLVRYELCHDGKPWTKCGSIDQPLEKVAPAFSDNFVHIPTDRTHLIELVTGLRNGLLHGDFEQLAHNAGCISNGEYFKHHYPRDLEKLYNILNTMMRQIDPSTGNVVESQLQSRWRTRFVEALVNRAGWRARIDAERAKARRG